jgi:hypothetical protein
MAFAPETCPALPDRLKFVLRLSALAVGLASVAALADPIRHPIAVFAGLDKTTGRIINFDVSIDETVQFGALQVTPRVCNTRPQTEAPQTTSFVEVDESIVKTEAVRDAKGNARRESKSDKPEAKRIFSGWMFAASPGLHGVEHPVYDVWLTDCKGGKEIAATPPAVLPDATATDPTAPPPDAADSKKKSRKSRKTDQDPNTAPSQPTAATDQAPGVDGAAPPSDPAATGKPKKKKKPLDAAPPPGAAPAAPAQPSLFPF